MEIQELKALIKESVREVLREEMLYVSDEEQADIEEHFGLPSDYDRDELVDMTDWVRGVKSLPDMRLSKD